MPEFSKKSNEKKLSCHVDLQLILNQAIEIIDFSVIKGFRGEEEQNKAFDGGFSKLKYPKSKHNKKPSMAVDIQPYPYPNHKYLSRQCTFIAGVVMGCAYDLDLKIRWGGDWNGNGRIDDNNFNDLFHFELL